MRDHAKLTMFEKQSPSMTKGSIMEYSSNQALFKS